MNPEKEIAYLRRQWQTARLQINAANKQIQELKMRNEILLECGRLWRNRAFDSGYKESGRPPESL